jgi:ribose/xylose/arabinose/galactoside ABC-type transport system permease subunit
MTRILVTLGAILIVVGLAWPWFAKLGLGRLPGDIVIEREGFRFYFPITTMVLVSLVVSVIFWLFRK